MRRSSRQAVREDFTNQLSSIVGPRSGPDICRRCVQTTSVRDGRKLPEEIAKEPLQPVPSAQSAGTQSVEKTRTQQVTGQPTDRPASRPTDEQIKVTDITGKRYEKKKKKEKTLKSEISLHVAPI